jgi:hypothetical protein
MKNASVQRADFRTQRDPSMAVGIKSLANDVNLQSLHMATFKHSDAAFRAPIYRPP